jgi:hypothetical protein
MIGRSGAVATPAERGDDRPAEHADPVPAERRHDVEREHADDGRPIDRCPACGLAKPAFRIDRGERCPAREPAAPDAGERSEVSA